MGVVMKKFFSFQLQVTSYKLQVTSYAFCLLLSAFCFLPVSVIAQKSNQKIETRTEVFTKNFKVNAKDILEVHTSFTKVVFQEWDKNEVDFTTTVTLNRATEKDMAQLLNAIKITTNQSGKKTNYKLSLSGNNLNKIGNYEINLLVKMPKDIFLNITSSFGNVELEDAFNNFNADIDFGDITIKNLYGNKNVVNITQGKLKMEQADELTLNMSFSTANMLKVDMLKLNSSFSTLKMERAKEIELNSSQDKISINNSVEKIKGEVDFGTLKIGSLKYSFICTKFSFSKITIDEIQRSFTNINIVSSQSTIVLNVPRDQSFAFDYSGSFTKFKDEDIRLNDATFKGGSNSVQMSGFYGKNRDSGKKIKIEASFGSVSLFER